MFYPGIADAGMYGEVYIPEHEFTGFFDENGTYTIFAGVKNKEYFPIIPTVTISIQDGEGTDCQRIQTCCNNARKHVANESSNSRS